MFHICLPPFVLQEVGIPVEEAEMSCDHVQALFAQPRSVFELLGIKNNKTKPDGEGVYIFMYLQCMPLF